MRLDLITPLWSAVPMTSPPEDLPNADLFYPTTEHRPTAEQITDPADRVDDAVWNVLTADWLAEWNED